MLTTDPISEESLKRLHPRAISAAGRVLALLRRMMRERTQLAQGTNRRAELELAWLEAVNALGLVISTRNFPTEAPRQVFLTGSLDGRPYFFSSPVTGALGGGHFSVALPAVIYFSERRDRARVGGRQAGGRVLASLPALGQVEAYVADLSADGIAIEVQGDARIPPGSPVPLRFVSGPDIGRGAFAEVRHAEPSRRRTGWTRIGLAVLPETRRKPIEIERLDALPAPRLLSASEAVSALPRSAGAELVRFTNSEGEAIAALVDWCGERHGAPSIIIPPAWGKTKETLLPLADVLIETFRAAGEPLVVVRLDGIRRRGESYNDPECRSPGRENLHYTFSQGYRDVLATLDFLERSPDFGSTRSLLVTFSVAAIEGRRAAVLDEGRRLTGWVSVVGATDPQSLMRVISGGIDYLGGADRGVSFGLQDVQGLLLDIDRAAKDAISDGIAFLDDARRDMARLQIPISWMHGAFDAWVDIERARHALSFGDTSLRTLLEVPVGHQLRDSREAAGAFALIAQECGRMLLGRPLEPIAPTPAELKQRRTAEITRLRRADVNLQEFWRDYLVGRDGFLGIELVMSTRAYRGLMEKQVGALSLHPGDLAIDLGCGVGALAWFLSQTEQEVPDSVRIVGIDFVREALSRGRRRADAGAGSSGGAPRFVAANLNVTGPGLSVPLRTQAADAVLASLLLNYLDNPLAVLREAFELLRPGGRLVVSSLRRDADVSRICVDGVAELRSGRAREAFGAEGEERLQTALQTFINDAGRLLDLEERGHFHFWDREEIVDLAQRAGFVNLTVDGAYGDPPQALLVYGERPSNTGN